MPAVHPTVLPETGAGGSPPCSLASPGVSGLSGAHRHRRLLVQPRAGSSRPPAPLRPGRPRPRDLRAGAADAEDEHPPRLDRRERRLGAGERHARLRLRDPIRGVRGLGCRRTRSSSRSSTRTTSSRRSRGCAQSGVRTAGRFVWEHFAAEHVEPAGRAFDADLLADRLRARALRGAGDREPARALRLPPGPHRRRGPAAATAVPRPEPRAAAVPRRLHEQAQADRRGDRGVPRRARARSCGWCSRRRSTAA